MLASSHLLKCGFGRSHSLENIQLSEENYIKGDNQVFL